MSWAFNLKGIAFVALGSLPGLGLLLLSPDLSPAAQNWLFAGGLFAVDMVYRYFWLRPRTGPERAPARSGGIIPADSILRRDVTTWWLTTSRGGSIMYMPAWLFSGVFLLVLFVVF